MGELNELNALCEDLTNSIREAKKYGIEKSMAIFKQQDELYKKTQFKKEFLKARSKQK